MTPDALLEALLAAVRAGDPQAIKFFPAFRDWYVSDPLEPLPSMVGGDHAGEDVKS